MKKILLITPMLLMLLCSGCLNRTQKIEKIKEKYPNYESIYYIRSVVWFLSNYDNYFLIDNDGSSYYIRINSDGGNITETKALKCN